MGQDGIDFPVAVVLPAAGCGERTGLPTPKQFCTFLNRPLISYTIETFERIQWIQSIIVVAAKESCDQMLHVVHKFHHSKVNVVEGGTTRHRSIFNGLQAFSESTEGPTLPKPKVVIIHDAVRPFVDEDFLLKITLAAKEHGCSQLDMEFGTECLHLALQYSGTSAKLIEGPPTLWKVTYKRDLAAAESIIKETLSLSACLISGTIAETVELASKLQKYLAAQDMAVDVVACSKGNTELLLKTRNFIMISANGAGLSEMQEMIKIFEDSNHALLYPVVIVWVHFYFSEEVPHLQKEDELKAMVDLSTKVQHGNVLLYGVQIIDLKVPELWETSVARLSEIVVSLIRDRNPAFTGQLLRV